MAFGQDGIQGAMKYWYNEETKAVNATIYEYSKATHEIGDSIAAITDAGFIQNRLWKLLDSHIVVGDIEKDGYYITKANDFIKVSEQGKVVQGVMTVKRVTRLIYSELLIRRTVKPTW